MSKDIYMLVCDTNRNAEIDIYEKKKLRVLREKINKIFGVMHKEFEDISNEYKATLVQSILMNFFVMTGVLNIDKENFLSQMGNYYDMAVEAECDGKIELLEDN